GEPHPMLGDIEGFKVQRFSVDEFDAQSRFQNIDKVIHVGVTTNRDPVLETAWLQALADERGLPSGIVARCDLRSDDAASVLDAHCAYPNVRGIRDNGQPGSFADPRWRQGYARLAALDLVFCHQVGVERLDEALALLGEYPSVKFCLDHSAMPRERSGEYFQRWSRAIRQIAAYPQVSCKVSALGSADRRWTIDSIRPWVLELIDAFGVDRCFFGSNFPVDGIFSTYSDLIEAFRCVVADFTREEQAKLLHLNANRIFRV
ncbi:MAG TPA: amidohydrolase family protein, partial [Microbacterium sp.]|uniref:amidohydrolase family protein n=1 Tax=Microbacterium sp. TaxID=51671 RepID=UPI002C086F8E